jgi:hypothetical protein
MPGIGDGAVANVDAVVAVSGMACDPFIFLVDVSIAYQDVAPSQGAGLCGRCVRERPKRCRFRGSTRPDSGPVQKAAGPAHYRRSTFRQSARVSAGAVARRTTVSWPVVRARETGRLLPLGAHLVARTVPLLSLHRFDDRGRFAPPVAWTIATRTLHKVSVATKFAGYAALSGVIC